MSGPEVRPGWMACPETLGQLAALANGRIAPICPVCGLEALRRDCEFDGRVNVRHYCCGMRSWGWKPLQDHETLLARRAAHAAFDPIWALRIMRRRYAYAWLAKQTGIPLPRCHMSLMTREQAESVVAACRFYEPEIRRRTLRGGLEAPRAL